MTFKVTGTHSRMASSFEVVVPPGFDVGAHVHTRSEELFYVLEGELDVLAFEPRVRTPDNWKHWESRSGTRVVRATPGTVIVVPPGCPHAFANPTDTPAKMFFQASRHRTTNGTSTNSWRSWAAAARRTTRRSRNCGRDTTSSSSHR